MQQITLRLPDDMLEQLDEKADAHKQSRSELIRNILASRNEYEKKVDDLQNEVKTLRAERDDLRRQLAAANQRIDASNEIVRYVEQERTVEQERRSASVVTRAKWWLFGMDDTE